MALNIKDGKATAVDLDSCCGFSCMLCMYHVCPREAITVIEPGVKPIIFR